jgi:quinol monooxygenase YgiN
VSCLMDQSTEDPNKFTLYERWREPSMEAFLRNQMKEDRQVYAERLPSFPRSPRTTMVLRSVRAWQN